MNTPNENECLDTKPENLFQDGLEIDEAEASRAGRERGKELDLSDELRLLARQNRLSLFKTSVSRQRSSEQSWLAEAELRLQSHAHPECRFVQVMLTVSLELTPGAKVLALAPEEAMMHPIKVTEVARPGFEAEIPGTGIKVSMGGNEKTTEQTFQRRVLSGYNGEEFAAWTFVSPAPEYELLLNAPLSLSIGYPASAGVLRANLLLSARVAMRGWSSVIPLIGGKSAGRQTLIYLDR